MVIQFLFLFISFYCFPGQNNEQITTQCFIHNVTLTKEVFRVKGYKVRVDDYIDEEDRKQFFPNSNRYFFVSCVYDEEPQEDTIVYYCQSCRDAEDKYIKEERRWKEFVALDGRFKVLFPKKPETKIRFAATKIDSESQEYEAVAGNVSCSLVHTKYPKKAYSSKDIEEIWILKKNILYGDFSGYESIEKSSYTTKISRAYIIENSLFELTIKISYNPDYSSIDKDKYCEMITNKFFGSFELLNSK